MLVHLDTDLGGIALGRVRATVEETAVRLRLDGGPDRDPDGHPVRLVTAIDGAAFAVHRLDPVAPVG